MSLVSVLPRPLDESLPTDVRAFEPGHRHDVVNEGPEVAMGAHVYSPGHS